DPLRSRLAILQSFDPALLVSAVPVVERRSRDPDWSQCRRIESDDCSTSSMISDFSDAEYLMKRPPHPRERCFCGGGFRRGPQPGSPGAGEPVTVTPAARGRLEALVADRCGPRAQIILATADGCGTAEIMCRSGKAKPAVWRWQARVMEEGV